MTMRENVEMRPHIKMQYHPYQGRVIRIEEAIDEQSRKAGVTPAAIELRPNSSSTRPTESLIAALIASFTFPYRREIQAPEGWGNRKAEWERQTKLADIRKQL